MLKFKILYLVFTISALFGADFTLTINNQNKDIGSIYYDGGKDGGFNCGLGNNSCIFTFSSSFNNIIQTKVNDGYRVKSWSGGGCSGKGSTCSPNLNSDTTITISFEKITQFVEPNPTNKKVELKKLNSTNYYDYVNLSWSKIDDIKSYEISYATTNNFVDENKIKVTNSNSYQVKNLSNDNSYYFRVRAIINEIGQTWSNVESTTLVLEKAPILNSANQTPKDKSIDISKTPTFTWDISDINGDSIEYYIKIGESSNNLNYKSGWIKDIKKFVYSDRFNTPLKPNTTYYWQIQYRETNRNSSYYGGQYPKSEIWSFKTVGKGADLTITNIKRIGNIVVDKWIPFEVTIKNIGTEKSTTKSIKPFIIKNGNKLEFKSYKHGYMTKDLDIGEEEKIIVKVRFSNKIETKIFTHYDGTTSSKTFDNILIDGENTIQIEIENNEFDTNHANDIKTVVLNYSLANNLPTINDVHIVKNVLSTTKGDYRYMLGWKVTYRVNASDQLKINKVDLEYRTSLDDNWHFIQSYINNNNSFYQNLEWTIPNELKNVTKTMQVRVKIYNPSGNFSSVVSPELKIFENNIGVNDIYLDKSIYKTGDPIIISYESFSKYKVDIFDIYINNNGFRKKLQSYNQNDNNSKFKPLGSIKFNIPTDTRIIGQNVKIEFSIKDINGAYKNIYSKPFSIEQNTQTAKEFSSYQDIFTKQYTNFPSNTKNHTVTNDVVKTIIDNSGLIHLLIVHHAQWWTVRNSGSLDQLKDDRIYYYMTYNPITKVKSTPIKMLSTQRIDSGHLSDEYFLDFIVNKNTAIVITANNRTGIIKKYQLNGNILTTQDVALDGYAQLINYNNKTYIYRVSDESIRANRRLKRREIYPNLGNSENIVDEYLDGYIRINNNLLYFYKKGIFFELDSNFKAINSTKNDLGVRLKYLKGNIDIYDLSVKEILLDEKYNIVLLNKDNTKEVLFNIKDSEDANRSYSNVHTVLSIYDNQIIMVYKDINQKYKVITYNRDTKKITSTRLGTSVNGDRETYLEVSINNNRNIIIGNPDRRYHPSAQIITADLSKSISIEPTITLTTDKEVKLNTNSSLIWKVSSTDNLQNIQVYKISKGITSLLTTITDKSTTSYSFTPRDDNEKFITFKIVANYIGGNSYYDIASINVVKNTIFDSFSTDLKELYLNQDITFSWSAQGNNNKYTIYRQCKDETLWTPIFNTTNSTHKYTIEDFTGVCKIKIVSSVGEKILDYPINVYGSIFKFKDNSFTPLGNYTPSKGIINFKWATWFNIFETKSDFTISIKKEGESTFSKIDNTLNNYYLYSGSLGNSFDWKVSFENNGKTIESKIVHVNVLDINIPTITSAKFDIINSNKLIKLEYSKVIDAESYDIYRAQYNNRFTKIGNTQELSYIDKNIKYGDTYKYYVIAQKGKDESKASNIVNVDAIKIGILLDNKIMDLSSNNSNISISIQSLKDITVNINDNINPIKIDANSSNGEKLTYQVSSSNKDIVVAKMSDNLLSLTLVADAIGESDITITVKVQNITKSIKFKIKVINSIENQVIADTLKIYSINNTEIKFGKTIEGFLIYHLKKGLQVSKIFIRIKNVKVIVDNKYNTTITIPISNMSILLDVNGKIDTKLEGFLLPKNILPIGTELIIEENNSTLIVPMINKLEF